jgi:hypothetical protein
MALNISYAVTDLAYMHDHARRMAAELRAQSGTLNTAEAVSRWVSRQGNARVRPRTTDDHTVDVEALHPDGEWRTIMTVHVR